MAQPTLDELRELLGEGNIIQECYTITPYDSSMKGSNLFVCSEAILLYFSYDDMFAINADLRSDSLVTVIVKGKFFTLYLVAGYYSDMVEYQDLKKIYRIKTECLLKPYNQIFFPTCKHFMLTCMRYKLLG